MKQKDTEFIKAFAEMVNHSVQQDIVSPRSYFNLGLRDLLQEYYADEPEVAKRFKNGAERFVEAKIKHLGLDGMSLYDLNQYMLKYPNAKIKKDPTTCFIRIEDYDFFTKLSDSDWENRVQELVLNTAYFYRQPG